MLELDQPAGVVDRREAEMSVIGCIIEDLNTNPILLEHIAPAMIHYNGSKGQDPFMITVAADDLGSSANQAVRRSGARKTAIMIALCLAGFLASLDIVITGTALPTIAKDLLASSLEYSWVGSAYLLASASLLTVWVRLSDIFGRKTVMIVCYLLFLSRTLVSALSQISRCSLPAEPFKGQEGQERGFYISVYSAATATGAILGQIVGGVLTGSGPELGAEIIDSSRTASYPPPIFERSQLHQIDSKFTKKWLEQTEQLGEPAD
ncbi:hypothetical protein EPUS_09066 [Endocarpon pusillum Z07020]|uniref:Major facilitator superfamily (MFS) profile domain-containing protein n=1 Tax=Endocarpon pusillum (strain Z07020 / HMAS-L-300199) TaxID=1263415 RepID=U1HI35_ENDPU|nr:uncharacterized protein EPUS_09066 [Endocarpon pusillum Z07020]ERF69850.1 hypothetical protein EPUS_09066 [Endocarpon pusillum Z07020]